MGKDRKLTYHPGLYVGDRISGKKLDKIKSRLQTRPFTAGVFLITLARNPKDQLDIFEARQLAQGHYEDCEFYVVGIASSREEALELVERMTGECVRERGDCDLREYFLC